jgi:hypothetical protein
MDAFTSEYLWIVIVGFIVSFFLAFGVGANDVAVSEKMLKRHRYNQSLNFSRIHLAQVWAQVC